MSEHNTDKSNDVETKFEPKYKRSKKVEVSERNTDKSDDNELRSEKNYMVECENNSMTSIKRESEEERMLRNIMKQREETIDRNNKFKSQSNQWEKKSKKTKMYLNHSRHDFRFNAIYITFKCCGFLDFNMS